MITFSQYTPNLNGEKNKQDQLVILCKDVLNNMSETSFYNWMNTAAMFPELSIENQLAVMVQKPQATKLLSFDEWNKAGCSIAPGAKSMALFRSQNFEDMSLTCVFDINDVTNVTNNFPVMFREVISNNKYKYDIIKHVLKSIASKEIGGTSYLDVDLESLKTLTFNYMYQQSNDKFEAKCLTYMFLKSLDVPMDDYHIDIKAGLEKQSNIFELMDKLDKIFSETYETMKYNYSITAETVQSDKERLPETLSVDTSNVTCKFLIIESGEYEKQTNIKEYNTIEEVLNAYPEFDKEMHPSDYYSINPYVKQKIDNRKSNNSIAIIINAPGNCIIHGTCFNILIGNRVIPQQEMKEKYIFDDIIKMPVIQDAINKTKAIYGEPRYRSNQTEKLYWNILHQPIQHQEPQKEPGIWF